MTYQPTFLVQEGDSQAVNTPSELAHGFMDRDLLIQRVGDELRTRPTPRSLKDIGKVFAQFSKNITIEDRGEERDVEREPLHTISR
jgi:antitoxin VapB